MNNIAARALRRVILRRTARAIVIKNDDAFDRLHADLTRAMSRAWADVMTDALTDALDRLRDLGPGKFTQADADSIMGVLEARLGADAIKSAMRGPVMSGTDALFRAGAAEVGAAAGVAVTFARPDLDALDALKKGNLFWVGESWNRDTRGKLDKILTEYFTDGMTRADLTARIADDFQTVTGASEVYFELLADHIATKGREIGRVTGYERAGIQRVQVRAHLDDSTTKICRDMHGRVITVAALRSQVDDYIAASNRGNLPEMKRVWTMHGAGSDLSKTPTKDLKGTASPPYHFRCRTITVAYYGAGDQDIDRWTAAAYDREPLSRRDVAAIVQQAKSAKWPHTKVVRGHFRKHQKRTGYANQAAYSQGAVDLIRSGNRDVYTSMRKGALNATFVREAVNKENGKPGFLITSVDLVENKITSHHWRKNLETTGNEVPAKLQPGRGIRKWLMM